MTDLDIIKECRQTGKTRTTTKKLLEKAYYEQMTNEIDISTVLIEGDTATIMGVKYKRVEEPKSPAEKAYYAVYGWYPPTTSSVSNYEDNRWRDFQNGYNASKVSETPQEPEELKTLYQMFENEGAYGQIYFDDALKVVKSWMSQYADNVMCGEYKKGYEECLTINLTLKELETLDKYLELNDKTRPLFDKIRNAYPKPTTLFDVRGRGKCLI
jgi:hypothetical protein